MNHVVRHLPVGILLGALLGGAWWALLKLISSGTVCSIEDWQCLGVGLIAMPVSMVVGGLVTWILLRAAGFPRPLGTAVVGVMLTALFTFLNIWVSLTAGEVVAGAIGFAVATAVTATSPVRNTAVRD